MLKPVLRACCWQPASGCRSSLAASASCRSLHSQVLSRHALDPREPAAEVPSRSKLVIQAAEEGSGGEL